MLNDTIHGVIYKRVPRIARNSVIIYFGLRPRVSKYPIVSEWKGEI